MHVDVVGVDRDAVSGPGELDEAARQRPPQPRDLGLQRVGCLAAEPLERHDPPGREQQPDQQRPRLRPGHGDGVSGIVVDFERPEDAEAHDRYCAPALIRSTAPPGSFDSGKYLHQ
ncbi:hypothetical protein GCM10020218_077720 [Dactylosporangium vinaceum]